MPQTNGSDLKGNSLINVDQKYYNDFDLNEQCKQNKDFATQFITQIFHLSLNNLSIKLQTV